MRKPRPDAIDADVTHSVISGTARRMRALRARRASGRVVVRIEVDEVAVPEMLVAAGLLDDRDTENRERIEAALAGLIDDWAGRYA